MDAFINQLSRELTDAIAAAVSDHPRIEACREKAKAAGLDLRVSLDAVIGFAPRQTPGQPGKEDQEGQTPVKGARKPLRTPAEMSATDRRFLKSLRISADEPTEKEVE